MLKGVGREEEIRICLGLKFFCYRESRTWGQISCSLCPPPLPFLAELLIPGVMCYALCVMRNHLWIIYYALCVILAHKLSRSANVFTEDPGLIHAGNNTPGKAIHCQLRFLWAQDTPSSLLFPAPTLFSYILHFLCVFYFSTTNLPLWQLRVEEMNRFIR